GMATGRGTRPGAQDPEAAAARGDLRGRQHQPDGGGGGPPRPARLRGRGHRGGRVGGHGRGGGGGRRRRKRGRRGRRGGRRRRRRRWPPVSSFGRADFLGAYAIVERGGACLFVQNERVIGGREVLTWDLPGGRVERGELLEEALARELTE